MTNYEKYKNDIEKFTCLGINFGFNKKTKEINSCYNTDCENCIFSGKCIENKMKWAYSEYIEHEIDWSNMPVDTAIWVSDDNMNWMVRHFAEYEDNTIYAWADGKTSYTTYTMDSWAYAKL